MSQQERSQSMKAFANEFGEPNALTSRRMRARLDAYMVDVPHRRRKRTLRWVAVAVVAALSLGGAAWAGVHYLGGGSSALNAGGVLATQKAAEHAELERGGELFLSAESRVKLIADDAEETSLVLQDGELELRRAQSDHRPLRIEVGEHELRGDASHLVVLRTRGIPVVTVHHGSVKLFGPGMPSEGVLIEAED